MRKDSVVAIVRALNDAGVRYLIAGGLAVIVHGYVRFTKDVDIILDLHPDNVRRAVQVLRPLGYGPRAPVPAEQFADPDTRASWIRDKHMVVFSLDSDRHRDTTIDIFVESPFDFDRAYSQAVKQDVSAGVSASFVCYDDLIALKKRAGRPQDVIDIEYLTKLREAARGDA